MKIAQITPYAYPHIGGVEIHVKNLSKALKFRHEVITISSNSGEVVLKSIPVPYSPIPLQKVNVEADVYHAHIPSPFFARMYADEGPFVVTYHNDVEVPNRVSGYTMPRFFASMSENVNWKITRDILDKADAVIATTLDYALTSPVLKEYAEKLHVIPNGIWVNDFAYSKEKEDFILYAGRLVEYKGLGTLLNALEGSGVKLVVAGDGEDREYFKSLAGKKNVDATFLGRIGYSELVGLMGRAKALVLPSKTRLEAFGIVLLEAMASGTPVIAYSTPGVRYVASHGGFVFRNELELREIIENLDDMTVVKAGKRGRKFAEMHDWSIIARKVEKLYMSLI
ncbi:glycosyltransferase family 4 protein [Geoglobus acetivorans]|uniref:Glycosyltransferase n=1 Tax=Geoglobus acetivorans TaxID=565033 RepID=A0A0A7GEJ2_GEOAI|nr:Glycosyltransferase [Geoglobus acetivorans]